MSISHLKEKEDQGWKEGAFRAECLKETDDSKLTLFKSGREEGERKGGTERERQRERHGILMGSYNLNVQSSISTLEFICICLFCASVILSSLTSFTSFFSPFSFGLKNGDSWGRIWGHDNVIFIIVATFYLLLVPPNSSSPSNIENAN